MFDFAKIMPILSGLSGSVRVVFGQAGQIKACRANGLGPFVRVVRMFSISLTCVRARALFINGRSFLKSLLGVVFCPDKPDKR